MALFDRRLDDDLLCVDDPAPAGPEAPRSSAAPKARPALDFTLDPETLLRLKSEGETA